ncbi:hypothetical protein ACMT4L_14615 [Deinococcus sp. A31D244]|uniref:hypothetical protein n=1 Tax=Deinococcus sp. A31D244 TaxID=3397675 RepID=UPI0039DFC832
MTDGGTDGAALERGRKLMGLYRGGVGGERANAGRLLGAHLRTHDLTLFDLHPALPVTQDLSALDSFRESAALFSQLGTDGQDDALTALVDADDLTEPELRRLLGAVDLHKLAQARVDGWASLDGVDPQALAQAAGRLTEADVLAGSGSLARRLRFAAARQLYRQTHPLRLIRTGSPVQSAFVRALLDTLSGHPSAERRDDQGALLGVEAHLSAPQLARARALIATFAAEADRRAAQAARDFGEELARRDAP